MKKEYNLSKAKLRTKPKLNAKEAKVQTSVRIDADIFIWLQNQSEIQHTPYQALMNKYLREAMNRPSVENRIAALEKAIFKKAP